MELMNWMTEETIYTADQLMEYDQRIADFFKYKFCSNIFYDYLKVNLFKCKNI